MEAKLGDVMRNAVQTTDIFNFFSPSHFCWRALRGIWHVLSDICAAFIFVLLTWHPHARIHYGMRRVPCVVVPCMKN